MKYIFIFIVVVAALLIGWRYAPEEFKAFLKKYFPSIGFAILISSAIALAFLILALTTPVKVI